MRLDNYNFQKLTPQRNADIAVYNEAINFAFENDDVKNIAISGAYSSGKSSIIESYKAKHHERRFIHLSLAFFNSLEQENKEDNEICIKDATIKESVLEGKILNQLIHQIPANKIPQTCFRVKKDPSITHIVFLCTLHSLIVPSFLFLLFYDNIITHISSLSDTYIKKMAIFFVNPQMAVVVSAIIAICCILITYKIASIQYNKNIFHKISLQGNEIEIFENQDESYFDKYLNEVLYLFENAEADVIVFEDLDRFNASKIFERLREVNTLVNIHRKKQKGKFVPLRFFYLIRDDIFISKDRTKFFDYIIPVVPIVDSSNSYEQLIKHFKKSNLIEKFSQGFLQGLSLYIDDMRIIKNIYNEFIVYFNRLNTTSLNCDKMLAMITYKNIFPRDFCNLQLKRGFVFEVFSQKGSYIEKEISNLTKQIESLDTSDIKSKLLHNDEEKLENIDNLQNKIYKLQHIPLKNIINRENINEFFEVEFDNKVDKKNSFKEIKGSEYFDLLKYLIRNGHIDESYADYMTYFYEDSISANDKTFLRRITDKRGAEYSYVLNEPLKVISSSLLSQVDFENEEVLNFDLLHCLLAHYSNDNYDIYLEKLILQIRQRENFDFLSQYYRRDISHEAFIVKLNEYWNDFFYTLLKNQKFSKEQVRKYSIETLYYSNDETVKSINIKECLKDYISHSDDYLQIKNPDIPKLIAKFKLLNVRFETFNYDLLDKVLFKKVYQEDLYLIKFANLRLILQKEYSICNEDDIVNKNYTLIQSDPNSPLAKYIASNLSEYIEVILQSCNNEICDELTLATYLLNCDDLGYEQKKRYVCFLRTMVNDISSIADTILWPLLLVQKLIVPDKNNVLQYYSNFGLTEELADYINASATALDFTNIENAFDKELVNKFFNSVINNNIITTSVYKDILLNLGYYCNDFASENIEDAKISILITEKIIHMTVENLLYLRKYYYDHTINFIKTNLNEYLELQTEEIFVLKEALQVIKLDTTVDKKIKFIALTSSSISIIDKEYEDELCIYILLNNLFDSDLDVLFKNYSMYSNKIKEIILKLSIDNIAIITENKTIIDNNLQLLLFKSREIDFKYKVILFDNTLPTLSEEGCCAIFDEIDVGELKHIFTRGNGRKKYNLTDKHIQILNVLMKHKLIYSYNIDQYNQSKYKIIKSTPKQK